MIVGTIWRIALVIIALVAAGVHFDRESIKTRSIAASVPEPFRASAQLRIAAEALRKDAPEVALLEAERLVQRRPMPAEHLRILAQAQFATGEIEPGGMTIQYAAQRGWRDPLAQESLLRLALEAGDSGEAARRYTALFLRRDTEDALLLELGPAVLSDPTGDGRATLAAIVAGAPRWHNQFLRRGPRVMPADAFVDVIARASTEGTRFDCALLEQSIRPVTRRDEAAAQRLQQLVYDQC